MATANFTDMSILATDTVFGNRVFVGLQVYCTVTIPGEAISNTNLVQHNARQAYGAKVLNNPNFYKPLFVDAVSANQTVANDATASGTLVGLTATQVATAAALCTDAHISTAVDAAFNSFICPKPE